MTDNLKHALSEITFERLRQKYDNKFDDNNTLNDWIAFITRYLGRANENDADLDKQTDSLIKAAAIIVAALESRYRNSGFAKRHYD